MGLFAALVVVPALASGARGTTPRVPSRTRDRSTWDSVFTAEQAARGQTSYNQTCARCHRETLAGGDEAPALTGSAFMSSWNGQTLDELHERVRTSMPTDTPGVYARPMITDVIAFMLRFNGFPAGAVELTHENEALKGIRFVAAKP
ncbi:MAG: cytochrome c [Gemmatimonadaceae bacterium]|nr:cytochrome c [Gemmatimonadaceae bacterium]